MIVGVVPVEVVDQIGEGAVKLVGVGRSLESDLAAPFDDQFDTEVVGVFDLGSERDDGAERSRLVLDLSLLHI